MKLYHGSNIEISKDSNCDLSGVSINGELISLFEPSVTDYNVKVENLSSVDVVPSLASDKAAYVIEKMDKNYYTNRRERIENLHRKFFRRKHK